MHRFCCWFTSRLKFDKNGIFIVLNDYKLKIMVSYNEKSDFQAIFNTAVGLYPTAENREVYRETVVYHWNYKMDEISEGEVATF